MSYTPTQLPEKILLYEEIREKAEKLLLDSGFAGVFPVPVDRIAKYLGFTTYSFIPSEDTRDVSGAVNHKNHCIYINDKDPLPRKVFTIAHEIGHIMLHGKNKDHIDYRTTSYNDPRESQADDFAACLLMPEAVFRKQWESTQNKERLANFFGVSKQAIYVRAHHLDLE